MKRPITLSIFFPAYNEEDNIAATVRHASEIAQNLVFDYEIIIVNDGSSDKTRAIAERIARENDHVKVVNHDPNQGYGAALWSGIQAAQYEYTFFTDADLQFDLAEMEKLVDFLPEYDVVLGYRAKRKDPIIRLINARGWNFLNRILFGLRVKDIDCAFKVFKSDLVKKLPLKTRGAMMSAEMLIRLQREGVVFKEVPVTHLPRTQGVATGAKPKVILRALRELAFLYKGGLRKEGAVTYMQALKFAAIGVLNTAIDFVSYLVLTRFFFFFSEHILEAKGISFFLGTIFSFVANRRFTFERRGSVSLAELSRFYVIVGIALLINVGSLYVFTSVFKLYDILGVVLATLLTFTWSFILSKAWVFKKEPSLEREVAHA